MGQIYTIKCPICGSNIQTQVAIDNCPACHEYIGDKLHLQGSGTGIVDPRKYGSS